MSKFAQFLDEKMGRSQLDRTLRAADSKDDVNQLKSEVQEFFNSFISEWATNKKVFMKAKSKPSVHEVELFMVAFKKLKNAMEGNEEGEE